jgi:hypothetical protein
MKWTPEAEAAVGKVPFFVRKRLGEILQRTGLQKLIDYLGN